MNVSTKRLLEVNEIVRQCSYPGYKFFVWGKVLPDDDATVWLRAEYDEPDTVTGAPEVQVTREWPINADQTKNQIVQTVFKCLLTSLEHRGREWFLYKGKSIFGPHYDVDSLWSICDGRS